MIISRWILLRMRIVSHQSCRESRNIHFTFNSTPPPPRKSCLLWDNVEKCGRSKQAKDDNTVRRMRFACRITKATGTHSEYVIIIVFHGNSGYEHASQCHVIRTLCVLLLLHQHFVKIQFHTDGLWQDGYRNTESNWPEKKRHQWDSYNFALKGSFVRTCI